MRGVRSIYIPLPEDAIPRLVKLAQRELRDPKAQAALLILEGLGRAGFPAEIETNERAELRSRVKSRP